MTNTNWFHRGASLGALALLAVACVAPTSDETTGNSESAITSGTIVNLDTNSFVRIPARSCSGTLLDNEWVLTADHCSAAVGDSVLMDSQVRTVSRVVRHPSTAQGVDIALLRLSSPMVHGGSTTAFHRALRTSTAPAGTHVRCFGYGQAFDATGVTSTLRLMELNTAGGANNVYSFPKNDLGQSAVPGDAGGACLDDTGAAIAIMRTYQPFPATPGQTGAVTSTLYASWAAGVLNTDCFADSDCSTNICNFTTGRCVADRCHDGIRNQGETQIDCGGPSCAACVPHCGVLHEPCNGVCVPLGTCNFEDP